MYGTINIHDYFNELLQQTLMKMIVIVHRYITRIFLYKFSHIPV